MNPFDLAGPEFLVFYLILGGSLLAMLFLLRRFGEPDASVSVQLTDPYEIAYVRGRANEVMRLATVGLIDRGIASGEFYECDSHVVALGYIGMTLGSYRWLRPSGRRTAKEIAAEFSTALLRGLIRDESIRKNSPLGP